MNDETRLALDDAETPVNPYSLLAAVNASARSANVAWLIFLGLMAYLLIAVASVTHRDLLLGSDITLPLLQVKIGLIRFFLLVPILLVLLHVGLLGKLALLARKTLEFDAALRMLESTDQRSHPLRLELDNFFLVQVIAGPERSRVVSAFLNSLSWLTLVIFPLALLLYVQVAFLPFHDGAVTMVHRLAVLADVVLLLLMGVFLARSDMTYFGAFWRTAVHNPGSLAFGVVVLRCRGVRFGRCDGPRRSPPRQPPRLPHRARRRPVRRLSAQSRCHRRRSGRRQGHRAGRALHQSARPRSALRPPRPQSVCIGRT